MSTLLDRSRSAKTPTESVKVEFMPGRIAEMPKHLMQAPPKYVICKMVKQPSGLYALVPFDWSPMVRMTRELCLQMGLPCSYRILYKLVKGGFVQGLMPTPRLLMIDLASLVDHFQRTRIDAEGERFWTTTRTATFREAEGPVAGD